MFKNRTPLNLDIIRKRLLMQFVSNTHTSRDSIDFEFDARSICYLETLLHRYFKEDKYKPLLTFAGSLECFLNIDFNSIKSIIPEHIVIEDYRSNPIEINSKKRKNEYQWNALWLYVKNR